MNPDEFARLPPRLKQADRAFFPSDEEAEAKLLCSCMIGGAPVLADCIAAGVTGKSFDVEANRLIFRAISSLAEAKSETFEQEAVYLALQQNGDLEKVGVPKLAEVSGLVATHAYAKIFAGRVREMEVRRILAGLADSLGESSRNGVSLDDLLAQYRNGVESLSSQTQKISEAELKLRARLESRRFNLASPPKESAPRFSINGKAVSTCGNLTCIIAQSKGGKSAFVGGGIASAIVAALGITGRDTLGVTSVPPNGQILIHIDTEQSRIDHDKLIRLTLRRSGVEEIPPWLWSFGCAGFTADELRTAFAMLLSDAKKSGGVFAVILDGTADFVNDVNDPAETNPFVAELHGTAIDYDCPIINVIHENPGQEGGKMRGHLGSQMERKSESNLRLKKSDEITVVFSDRQRNAPILEKDGPRFKWGTEEGMHVSCQSATDSKDIAKREKFRDMAEGILQHAGKDRLRYSDFLKATVDVLGVGRNHAETRFTEMKKFGAISKDLIGTWGLKDP